jgi:hypothetical protein
MKVLLKDLPRSGKKRRSSATHSRFVQEINRIHYWAMTDVGGLKFRIGSKGPLDRHWILNQEL